MTPAGRSETLVRDAVAPAEAVKDVATGAATDVPAAAPRGVPGVAPNGPPNGVPNEMPNGGPPAGPRVDVTAELPVAALAAPTAAPAPGTAAPLPSGVGSAPLDAVDILLVDDRPENLLALEAILEPLGQRLVRAGSGEEALRQLLVRDFALILLDVQMPGLNGFETAALIKARERTRHIPIIFLTAISKDEEYVFRGYEVGAVDYLFKPFNPDVLRSKVAVFVELHHRREQLRRQERALREGERRELELRLRTELLESEARSAAQLEAINRELQARQAELEAAMQSRSRFYASMSHELRTPINAIIGYNTLLLDNIYGPLNQDQAHGIERTHRAAKHLLELVNDVLDLSKIEAGKFELTVQPTSFPGLIEDLFVTVRPLADEHGCELTLRADDAPRTIETDPRRVRQILLNLLSNAIKYGEGKPIEVAYANADDGGIAIAVHDSGPGITQADLPRVFDEFVQLANAHHRGGRPTGTGLGLPISKRLTELLGGVLTAESTVGEGSTFRLVLPEKGGAGGDGAGGASVDGKGAHG